MDETLIPAAPVNVAPQGPTASAWYGLLFLLATEAALFIYLLFSYFLLASQAPGQWPPDGVPEIQRPGANTVILLLSSATAWWSQRSIANGASGKLIVGLSLTLLLGCIFTGVQIWEWTHKSFSPASNAYGSLYFTITALHVAHVVIGLIVLACLIVWAALGRFSAKRHLHVLIGVTYWHFVDAVWIAVFTTFFLTPMLG